MYTTEAEMTIALKNAVITYYHFAFSQTAVKFRASTRECFTGLTLFTHEPFFKFILVLSILERTLQILKI